MENKTGQERECGSAKEEGKRSGDGGKGEQEDGRRKEKGGLEIKWMR